MNSKPSKQELLDSYGKSVPDVIEYNLSIVFCGINPSLYTAAVGHHFARPGNRFWLALYKSGITQNLLLPSQEKELLTSGCGITNLVSRATAKATEITTVELEKGASTLTAKAVQYKPKAIAILGIDSYKKGFRKKSAIPGLQSEAIGNSSLWVLPNPSGLNASYQINEITHFFEELRKSVY